MVHCALMPKNSRSAMLKALFAVLVWGASFVATKVSLRYIEPAAVVWLRFAMGVVILGVTVLARRQFRLPERKDWLYLALLGFLGITFHQWLQSTGLVTAQAVTTGWITASIPIFMALLGWLVLRERLAWFQVVGIFLAAFGVLLVVTHGDLARRVSYPSPALSSLSSNSQYLGAAYPPGLEFEQCLVCLAQVELLEFRPEGDLRG